MFVSKYSEIDSADSVDPFKIPLFALPVSHGTLSSDTFPRAQKCILGLLGNKSAKAGKNPFDPPTERLRIERILSEIGFGGL